MKPFDILSKKIILDEEFCKIEQQKVRLPNGELADWWIDIKPEVVAVVPFLPDGRVLLQKNYKHGAGKVITEVVAGMVELNEPLKEAAARELTEETGYIAKKLIKVGKMFANPTGSNLQYHIFVAIDCEKAENNTQKQDAAEQIEPFLVENLAEAKKLLIDDKTETSSTTLSAILLAEGYFLATKEA